MEFTSFKIHPDDFSKFTPVMQQYLNARHGLGDNTVLFFRMGDFYEAFFTDAEIIAKELEITLTGKAESSYPGGKIPMAGVPAKAVEPYTAKLLERGYKVCIAEQMADPSTCKGLVPREIVKTLTPGTINELNLLKSFDNNFIAAIFTKTKKKEVFVTDNSRLRSWEAEGDRQRENSKAKNQSFGFAYADVSTGEFYTTELNERELYQEIARLNPAEIIVPSEKAKKEEGEFEAKTVSLIDLEIENKSIISNFDKKNFDLDKTSAALLELFKVASLDGFGLKDLALSIQAAGAIVEYLKETQKTNLPNFDTLKNYKVSEFMLLDSNTRKNLELTKNSNGIYDGSLMWSIDKTSSNLGKRRLKSWLEQPLFNISAIEDRQSSVKELFSEAETRTNLATVISKIYDIERLSNRLAAETINPRELASLKDSLLRVPEIEVLIQNFKSKYISKLKNIPPEITDLVEEIEIALVEEPPVTITEGEIIREGFNSELDEYKSLVRDSKSWLKNFEETEREKTGIKNLKVSFNKVHGYFIEVTKGNLKSVPEHYIARQTMVNTSRFITPELKDFEEKITNAQTRRNSLEHSLYTTLRKSLSSKAQIIKELASDIANLDAILSLSIIAAEQDFVCPEVDESFDLHIVEGRHPVIEKKLALGKFVPNCINLERDSLEYPELVILTGPNMAGKSTYMRQNALIILLAQVGSFVPASEAKIGLVDRIFTRIGASDDLSSGQSTFMVEMNEAAAILNGMSNRSFIVLDEIGRGTSTYDGVSIAWAIIEHIAKTSRARTIFATHYHELADLETMYPNLANYQMMVSESNNSEGKTVIEFLHKVSKGSADRSYGIEVARLAGLPKEVLSRAKSINSQLQSRDNTLIKKKPKNMPGNAVNEDGELVIERLPLFSK